MEADELTEVEGRILIAAYRFEFGEFLQIFGNRDGSCKLPKSPAGMKGWRAGIPSVARGMLYVASCIRDKVDGASFDLGIKRLRAGGLLKAVKSPIGGDVFSGGEIRVLSIPAEWRDLSHGEWVERAKADGLERERERFYPYSIWRVAEPGPGIDFPLFVRTDAVAEDSERGIDRDLFVAQLTDDEGHVVESYEDELYGAHLVLSRPEGVRIARTLAAAIPQETACDGKQHQRDQRVSDAAACASRVPDGGDNAASATMYLVRWWNDSVTGEECSEPITELDDLDKKECELLEGALHREFIRGASENLHVWKLDNLDPVEALGLRKQLAENERWIYDYEMAGGDWETFEVPPQPRLRQWVEKLVQIKAAALKYVALIKADRARVTKAADGGGAAHRLELSECGGWAVAILDGQSHRLARADAAPFLCALLKSQPNPIKLSSVGVVRPDRVYKSLPPALHELIEKPGRGQSGYRFKVPVAGGDEGPTKVSQPLP